MEAEEGGEGRAAILALIDPRINALKGRVKGQALRGSSGCRGDSRQAPPRQSYAPELRLGATTRAVICCGGLLRAMIKMSEWMSVPWCLRGSGRLVVYRQRD